LPVIEKIKVAPFLWTTVYIYGIYNAQRGQACSSNQRHGLLLGGSLGMEGMEVEWF